MTVARLEVEGLRLRLGGRELLAIDGLAVNGGEVTVVIGDAGSGKTLLAAALDGTLRATGGVRVDGCLLGGPPSRRRRAGLAAAVRDGRVVAGCTVAEALRLAARRNQRDGEALDRFPQLGSRARLAAELLSGGEQQLLQVACAWCARPAVLVLDAPTGGLAGDAAAMVVALARDEAQRGCAVLWLEQDRRAAPTVSAARLVSGRLGAPGGRSEAGSGPGPGPAGAC